MIDLTEIQYALSPKALAIGVFLVSAVVRADISPECSRYNTGSEYYKTCASYAADKVEVLGSVAHLNQSVSGARDGQLLLVNGGSYPLDKPLRLINGKGLLPASEDAFIELVPGKDFDTAGERLFHLVFLGNKSALSGIKVDGEKLATSEAFKRATGKKTLVYSSGTHGFRLSWSDLTGTEGLHALLLSDSGSGGEDIEGGTYYRVYKNWMETNGAAYGVSVQARLHPFEKGTNEHIDIQHNAIILNGGETGDSPDQCGLSVTNGDGQIRNNYLVYRGKNPPPKQTRSGIRLTRVAGTIVRLNSLISEMPKKRSLDVHFNLLEYQPFEGDLQAEIIDNSVDTKATLWTGDVSGGRIESRDIYESDRIRYFQTREQFFARGGLGGACLVNRHLLDNMNQTRHELPANISLSRQVCGTETSLANLNRFEGCPDNEPLSTNNDHVVNIWLFASVLGLSVTINLYQFYGLCCSNPERRTYRRL